MRSRGLCSLLRADHIPPSFSPCDAISARSLSFLSLAFSFSRCSISWARIASVVLRVSSVSKSGSCVTLCRFFFRRVIQEVILWCDSLLWCFAVVLMSSLYCFHRSWGLVLFRSGCSLVKLSISAWSFRPRSATVFMSFLFYREETSQVHLPFPMYGASQGANFTDTSQWSVGTGEALCCQLKDCCAMLDVVYIRSSRDLIG